MIIPELKGDAHIDPNSTPYMPFAVGDVDPEGPFVHVFDETALDLVMSEMDTVSDFVQYLQEREQAIRGKRLLFAPGEAEMLALYMQTRNADHEHEFPRPQAFGADPDFAIMPISGLYQDFVSSPAYKRKKAADAGSYIWDELIRTFTDHILAGTSIGIADELPTAARAEPGLRIMARESRLARRALGSAFADALREAERQKQERFTRVAVPDRAFMDPEAAGYIFMVLAYPTKLNLEGGYEQYRKARVAMLETYCFAFLYEHRNLRRMVGIALDASSRVTGREGGSEDLVAVEVKEWTPELERDVQRRRSLYEILQLDRVRTGHLSMNEYPELREQPLNRQQRRAARRKAARAGKRPT
jgi:hypothetical protein